MGTIVQVKFAFSIAHFLQAKVNIIFWG